MGWNLSRRKTLILITIIAPFFICANEPIESKKHTQLWKKESGKNFPDILNTLNNYKEVKLYQLTELDIELVNKQLNKKSLEEWKKYIQITYKRMLPFRDFIAEEIIKNQVPIEILYLPIIESAANSMARSNKGATGLWQFMESSSYPYNMEITEWLDERRDFVKSTRGAVSKLNYNYQITGDWLLALAAYNCGLNRVTTTVKNSGVSDYWELSRRGLLPRETVNYIPKLLTVNYILFNKNKFEIPVKWDKNSWDEVELDSAVDLRIIANLSGIPYNTLKQGNSELNYDVTPPVNMDYRIKIPSNYLENFNNALLSQENLMQFYSYKVKSGDTLSEIGYYYGLSTSGLIKYNPGVNPNTLRAGKTLIIPAVKKVEPYNKFNDSRKFINDYIVKDGDTLWDIAVSYKTTVEEIAQNSGLSINSYIKKGMILKVP